MNVLTVLCRGGWMPRNLSEGWRRLGCSVEEYCYGTHMGKSWDRDGVEENREINRQLLTLARRLKSEGRLDLIFMVIYDDVLEVETAKKLRSLDVPMVNYHVDLVGQWYRILRTAKYFDRIACAHRDHWGALVRIGARPFYMPMAANELPEPGAAAISSRAFPGVLYLGAPMPYRRQVLARLIADKVPVRIFGHDWAQFRPEATADADPSKQQPFKKSMHDARHYLVARIREEGLGEIAATVSSRLRRNSHTKNGIDEFPPEVLQGSYSSDEFAALVRGASINLGFTHFKGTPGTASERRQMRLRDFEIPMAGGFYLTQDCAQLRELFEVGRHIDTWENAAELLEKCRYYLGHDELRRTMAQSAQTYSRQNHTWERRLASLLNDLGLPRPHQGDSRLQSSSVA